MTTKPKAKQVEKWGFPGHSIRGEWYSSLLSILLITGGLIPNAYGATPPEPSEGSAIYFEQLPVDIQPEILSPPQILSPVYACGTRIDVIGANLDGEVHLYLNGQHVGTEKATKIESVTFNLQNDLSIGDELYAIQEYNGYQSPPSATITVRDPQGDYLNGYPRPKVAPTPLYECGKSVSARQYIDQSHMTIFSSNSFASGPYRKISGGMVEPNKSIYVSSFYLNRPLKRDEWITAQYSLCADKSPLSYDVRVSPEPKTIPHPTIINTIFKGARTIMIGNILNGATIVVENVTKKQVYGPFTSPVRNLYVTFPPNAIDSNDEIVAVQRLCNRSKPTSTIASDCSSLSHPVIRPPEIGKQFVQVVSADPGARIQIFDGNMAKIGDGTGKTIGLIRPIYPNDTLIARQIVGECISKTAWRVGNVCKDVYETEAPTLKQPNFTSSSFDYNLGVFDIKTNDIYGNPKTFKSRVAAHVTYPVDPANPKAGLPNGVHGRYPLIVMFHGNHGIWHQPQYDSNGVDVQTHDSCTYSPGSVEVKSHLGYDYLMHRLSKLGYIVISIDGFNLNCLNNIGNINERSQLILQHLELWSLIDKIGDKVDPMFKQFRQQIDLENVGLIGHSRGGEAVIRAAELIRNGATNWSTQEIRIKGIVSLAPTESMNYVLSTTPLQVILSAADGDVVFQSGAIHYDRASAAGNNQWFKTQAYIYGANHNYYNRIWLNDEGYRHLAKRLTRTEQEQIFTSLTTSFFETTIRDKNKYKPILSGDLKLAKNKITYYTSFEDFDPLNIDNFEDSNVNNNNLHNSVYPFGSILFFDQFFLHDFYKKNPGQSPYFPGSGPTFVQYTNGLIFGWNEPNSRLTEEIFSNLSPYKYLSFRVAQIYHPINRPYIHDETYFNLSLEAVNGVASVSTKEALTIPYPYLRYDVPQSLLTTVRIPLSCITYSTNNSTNPLDLSDVKTLTFSPASKRIAGLFAFDQISFTH